MVVVVVVTQCMQSSHVQKCQGHYISNVCIKFDAKLGGQRRVVQRCFTTARTSTIMVLLVVL